MGKIIKAVAYCNNEVAFTAWDVGGINPGCLGFDIVRYYPDTNEERALATWVRFQGQDNQGWKEQDTGAQYSDLAKGHAEMTFKVPNPFYFIL